MWVKKSFSAITSAMMFCVTLSLATKATADSDSTSEEHRSIDVHKAANSLAREGSAFARAQMESRSGSEATGKALFVNKDEDLLIVIHVENASTGNHGIHIHEAGDCSADDASSAGDHFNPDGHDHGLANPRMFHAGDLGNVYVNEAGVGLMAISFASDALGSMEGWDEFIGKSVVLHAEEDDFQSQPSGDSGDRIACGVIEKL